MDLHADLPTVAAALAASLVAADGVGSKVPWLLVRFVHASQMHAGGANAWSGGAA